MKKVLLLTISMLFLLISPMMAKIIDIHTARLAARNFYYERLTVNLNQGLNYNELRFSSEFTEFDNSIPVWYIFNFTDRGYIIIAAEDACYPVLGYSFEATLSPDMVPAVMKQWMENYRYEIVSVRKKNAEPGDVNQLAWEHLASPIPAITYSPVTTSDVSPIITSLWNQDFPYNAKCPEDAGSTGSYYGRVPVGCVATSMSQIMHYWRYPATGNSSHCIWPSQPVYGQQCANFGSTTYDWNGMPNQTSLESDALSTLAYHCSVSVDMQFAPAGSGSNLQKSAYALRTYFNYASSTIYQNRNSDYTTWINTLKSNVDAGQPVQYGGDDNISGHAFVLDGYQQVGSDYMFHFNWGWGGSANGYFYINNLNPNGYNFNYHQCAVVGIRPDPNQYPAQYFCNGVQTIGTNFGAIEDGSGPVDNYSPNGTCSWLIAPDDSIKTITLNFVRFATAADHFVKVYDGDNAGAPLLASYSGSLTTIPSVTSTGPRMFITFNTPGTLTAQGWLANFSTTVNPFCGSSTTITYPVGTINDGSGRFNYRNISNCKWKITPTGVTKVVLTVNNFKTEEGKDKVMVYDLGTSALLATWSGNYTTMPAPITSATGGVMIVWGSNNSGRDEGWDISFSPMVGVTTPESFENLTVYPNPAHEILNIEFNSPKVQNVNLSLATITGNNITTDLFRSVSGNFKTTLDISGLPRGIYLLNLRSEQGNSVQKIVIQ